MKVIKFQDFDALIAGGRATEESIAVLCRDLSVKEQQELVNDVTTKTSDTIRLLEVNGPFSDGPEVTKYLKEKLDIEKTPTLIEFAKNRLVKTFYPVEKFDDLKEVLLKLR
jgi:hypothetical protein